MFSTLTILIAAGVLLLLGITGMIFFKRRNNKPIESRTTYIEGLNALLVGDYDQALQKLRETVKVNTDFIDAYVKIGDIVRKQGHPDHAVKVHKDLLVRPNLTQTQRLTVLKSLVLDYHENKQYNQALVICDEIFSIDKKNEWCGNQQLNLYEKIGDWQNAFDVFRKNSSLPKEEKATRLACYKVELGKQFVELNRERDARLCFREAMKLDENCVAAYLELADSYIRVNREQDSLPVLKKLVQKNPDNADLAFLRLKQVLFEMGTFGDIEKIYIDLLKSNPDVVEAHLGLAEIYEKKGQLINAVDACKKALTVNPSRLDAKLQLVRYQSKLGRDDIAAEIASELAEELLAQQSLYICQTCDYKSSNYFWHCPQCSNWNTAKRD